jgi:uncharacterized membrane protein
MSEMGVGFEKEFEELTGSLINSTRQLNDPVAIGAMLYSIAEERKNTNLIIKNLNSKIDALMNKIENFEQKNPGQRDSVRESLSERDSEVLEFVRSRGRVDALTLMKKFKYKGKNAASARLSRLFHEGYVKKEYAGRKVYYIIT